MRVTSVVQSIKHEYIKKPRSKTLSNKISRRGPQFNVFQAMGAPNCITMHGKEANNTNNGI